ncbi:hypothetical protein Tco_0096858 [Tanacetum coccineum]
MELHDVSYGIEYVARPLLLFFSSENRLLWFRYREYDLAHLKLVFEFSIYNVWKSVQYGVSNGLDTAYWGFLGVGTTFDIFQNIILIPYLEYGVLSPLDTAKRQVLANLVSSSTGGVPAVTSSVEKKVYFYASIDDTYVCIILHDVWM